MAGSGDDTAQVTFTIGNSRPVASKALFALVDVEVHIAGIHFPIQGVQARRLSDGGTSVHLPTYRDPDGTWKPAIRLPDDVRAPLAEAVLAFLVEEGLARPKFRALAGSDFPRLAVPADRQPR